MPANFLRRRIVLTLAAALGLAVPLSLTLPVAGHAAPAESLSVNLASTRGPVTGVGEGFLYGISQDGTQPADQYLQPLGITAYRGGGHASGGWIADGYRYGSATQADVNEIVGQAKRLTKPPYHAQYQVIMSDLWGADGSQPGNAAFPCDNGDCSSWISFLDATVGALQNSGLSFAYDVWNEPDISLFWTRGENSAQYFQMWDAGVREIRRIAGGAQIVGPSLAYTPQQNDGAWQTWLQHTKSAGTLPDVITDHNETDGDDPVAVAQAINGDLSGNGISARPLSSNEFDPEDQQSAGQIAWYLARLAQSGYSTAMLGNWNCCETPNLTGILTDTGGGWQPTGKWWAFRDYADLTGTLVNTSGQVGSTAISASEDSNAKRAVAIIGDDNGFTGAASVTFSGLGSTSWLSSSGNVNVTVDRIPDQSPLGSPQVVYNQNLSASSGSVTVPVTFQAPNDAFAVYVTPAGSGGGGGGGGGGGSSGAVHAVGAGKCLDVNNSSTTAGTQLQVWDCNGQANQTWTRGSSGQLSVYSGSSTMCLDANGQGKTNGTKVIIWPCNNQPNQQWQINGNGTITGVQSGLCLDVTGASTADGALVELWTCNGQSNQQWTFG